MRRKVPTLRRQKEGGEIQMMQETRAHTCSASAAASAIFLQW